MSNRWRQGEKETYNGDKSTTNSEKDFAGGVIVVEDDVLWGEGRENMVVGKRERWEAGWRTDGQVVAASSAVGVGSSRGHGTPDTKHKKHKQTGFATLRGPADPHYIEITSHNKINTNK